MNANDCGEIPFVSRANVQESDASQETIFYTRPFRETVERQSIIFGFDSFGSAGKDRKIHLDVRFIFSLDVSLAGYAVFGVLTKMR